MIANPIGALITIIGLVVVALQKLSDKISIAKETMEKLNVVGKVLEIPLNALSVVIDYLAGKVADLVGWLVNLAEKLPFVGDTIRETREAAEAMTKATNELEDATMALAKTEADVAEAKAKAADEDLTLTERTQNLTAAHEAESKALNDVYEAEKAVYDAMQKQAALSPTTEADTKKLNEQYIKMQRALQAVNDEQRTFNKTSAKLVAKAQKEEADRAKAIADAHAKAAEAAKRAAEERKKAAEAARDAEIRMYNLLIDNTQKYEESYRTYIGNVINLEYERDVAAAQVVKDETVRDTIIQMLHEKKMKRYAEEDEAIKKAQQEYAMAAKALEEEDERKFATLMQQQYEYDEKRIAAIQELNEYAKNNSLWTAWSDPDKALEAIETNQRTLDALQREIEAFNEWNYESAEAAAEAKAELDQRYVDQLVKMQDDEAKKRIATNSKVLKSTQATFGQMSSALEGWSEKSKAANVAYKATASAETVMATSTGAMEAYKAMAGIPYVGPALGIAAAAAVVAEGALQLKNINSAESGSVSTSGASASTGSVSTAQTTTLSAVESAYIESRSESSEQKVTIVASDIAKAYDDYKAVEVANQ